MKITRRLQQFIKETAMMAMNEPEKDETLTFDDCVKEYTDQIVSDDYECVVTYAENKKIKIPRVL